MLEKIKDTETEFPKFFGLIEKSFPSNERRPYDRQKLLFSDPAYSVYALYGENRAIKACLAVWDFENFAFFEHFAVDPEYRNCGIGTKILAEAIDFLKKPVCLEAELPETELAKRRLGFYKRNGFFVNDYDYVMPPLNVGEKPLPLLILTHGRKITENEFLNMQSTVYERVYGLQK